MNRPVVRDEHGSVATELTLTVPIVLLIIGFVVVAGRIGEVRGAVVHAAHQAARAASLQGSPDVAYQRAQHTARSNLDAQSVLCADLVVDVDTSRFVRGGDVGVTVNCTVDLSSVAFMGLPGHRTVTARAVEVLDLYRGGT